MNHLIMQCHAFREDRNSMFKEIRKITCDTDALSLTMVVAF